MRSAKDGYFALIVMVGIAGLFAMTEKRLSLHGKPQVNWLMCPTCRQHTDCRNIAYAVEGRNKSYPSSYIVSENYEASINVQGSYSTKVFLTFVLKIQILSFIIELYFPINFI